MASQTTQSPSRIPLPVKNSPTPTHIPVTGIYVKDMGFGENTSPLAHCAVSQRKENGNIKGEKQDPLRSPPIQKGKGFDTFLMTGEMIIHTNPIVTQKLVKHENETKFFKESHIPRIGQSEQKQTQIPRASRPQHQQAASAPSYQHQQTVVLSDHQQPAVATSLKLHSKIPGPVRSLNSQPPPAAHHNHSPPHQNVTDSQTNAGEAMIFPLVHAPVAEMEELSDMSQSSCSEGEPGSEIDAGIQSPSLPAVQLQDREASRLEQASGKSHPSLAESTSTGLFEVFCTEPPSSGDSGFAHDSHISDPDLTGRGFINSEYTLSSKESFLSDETLTDKEGTLVNNIYQNAGKFETNCDLIIASSGEKFSVHGVNSDRLFRTSKSHENYLQAGTGIALVSIDIEDNLAYSLDTLTYHDSPDSYLDNAAAEHIQTSRSLDNSPEKKSEKSSSIEREFIPGFISLEDSKPARVKISRQKSDSEDTTLNESTNSGHSSIDFTSPCPSSHRSHAQGWADGQIINGHGLSNQVLETLGGDTPQHTRRGEDPDADSLYHQPSKAVDRPSAERLAKRLFHLEGFRKSDVSRHLCKKNDFSNSVAEEYLKFFQFQGDTLDEALRKFLSRFSLYGETQERERVLAHFSRRFMECNPGSFNSEDACHTLTCAIMLLNSDLHAPNVSRRMTCQEFIENLAELNDGDNFSKEVLKAIYGAIKNEPIEWAVDEMSPEQEGSQFSEQSGSSQSSIPQTLGSNPFLEVPDPSKTTEYKKGYVMRKCCMEPDRRKTPFGRRGWKMLYAVLQDMILYQYKDEHQLKKGQFVESSHNAIRIHHALATKASDYTKKQHVFRLQTADWAEYLFQTGDSKELQEWVDTINLVAASLSAPVLPSAVGSKAKFQRQLLPSSCTRLNIREQLVSHEARVGELEQELHSHHTAAPDKGAKSSAIQDYMEKESYLEFELKRFKTYVYLLQGKLMAFPDPEPSLAVPAIGEHEEMGPGPSYALSDHPAVITAAAKSGMAGRSVQRSMSDRYSYRAAIFQGDHVEYDMV